MLQIQAGLVHLHSVLLRYYKTYLHAVFYYFINSFYLENEGGTLKSKSPEGGKGDSFLGREASSLSDSESALY